GSPRRAAGTMDSVPGSKDSWSAATRSAEPSRVVGAPPRVIAVTAIPVLMAPPRNVPMTSIFATPTPAIPAVPPDAATPKVCDRPPHTLVFAAALGASPLAAAKSDRRSGDERPPLIVPLLDVPARVLARPAPRAV